MVYDTNAFLSQDQMTVNAQYIMDFLYSKGWTKNAICGLLGNLQSESSINFGIWEGLNEGNMSGGFGLTQWTPASKYFDWANANGYSGNHVDGELNRLLWEVANNQQWFGGVSSSMTFQQWTQSTDTPYNLAMDFIVTYEHPANPNQPIRGTQAENWFSLLTPNGTPPSGGGGDTGGGTTTSNNQLITLLLCDALHGWK
jgi:hypothetical protein